MVSHIDAHIIQTAISRSPAVVSARNVAALSKSYPAVYVTPSDNENDYETTTENLRVFAWKVRCFYETKDSGIEGAMDALMDLVDDLIDLFDQENEKKTNRTVGVGLPTRYTYIQTLASPLAWYSVENENIIYAEVVVKIKVSVDVSP